MPPSNAELTGFAMLSASEPATPKLPVPAPDVAVALKRCVPSPDAEFIAASTASASEVIAVPVPTLACVRTSARSIATAAPTPVAAPVTALPSALEVACVAPVALSETMPPAETVNALPIVVDEDVDAMLMPIAAATLTAPLDVFAAGVGVPPLPPPPGAFASASERWLPACCVTSAGPEAAPPALACAVLDVVEACSLESFTSPVACTSRASVAEAAWFATVSARPAPSAALTPVAAA